MYFLEDWIKRLLSQPIEELNRKYIWASIDVAYEEVESLPEVETMRYGKNAVSSYVLQELHEKIRG